MAFKVIEGGADTARPDGDDSERVIDLGALKSKSVYVYSGAFDDASAAIRRYAVTHRYTMAEVWSAMCDIVARDPSVLDDYMLKYEKARAQKSAS